MIVWFLDFRDTLDKVPEWPSRLRDLLERGDKVIINTGGLYDCRTELDRVAPDLVQQVYIWPKQTPREGLTWIEDQWPEAAEVILSDDQWEGYILKDVTACLDKFQARNLACTYTLVRAQALNAVIRQRLKESAT